MNGSILVIDDDRSMCVVLETLLTRWGYTVHTAISGEEGLKLLEESTVDVVLTDVQMPGITGSDVLAKIREEGSDLPVILMTAHGSVKDAVKAIQEGAFDYTLKPLDESELQLALHRALEYRHLKSENRFLKAEVAAGGLYGERLLGQSPRMTELFDLIERVAKTDTTVLICGETGTGKELVARALHLRSPRNAEPFLACNCAALNANLLESELFGHERGAFTGAVGTRQGRFESAHGGTLFLDEISETSVEFQAKLLRVLQEREFERVGGSKTIKIDVRILASTNRELETVVKEGDFREDLYYRLRVVPIRLPALRERGEDILLLARHFLAEYRGQYGSTAQDFSPSALDFLMQHPWPGNVRELQHTIERAVVLATSELLEPDDFQLDHEAAANVPCDRTLQAFVDRRTSEYLIQVLDSTGWQKQKAADLLGVDRATLYRMLKKYQIEEAKA